MKTSGLRPNPNQIGRRVPSHDPNDILRYWHFVEKYDFNAAERHNDVGDDFVSTHVVDRAPWPMNDSHGNHYEHTVQFGLIPTKSAYRNVLRLRKDDGETALNVDDRFTFLGAFGVDDDGVPLLGTLELSEFPQVLANALSDHITDKNEYSTRAAAWFEEVMRDNGPDAAFELADKLSKECLRYLHLDEQLVVKAPRFVVLSRMIEQRQLPAKELEAIEVSKGHTPKRRNSRSSVMANPFVKPLESLVADLAAGRPCGVADILLSDRVQPRVDCMNTGQILSTLAPAKYPAGRWPSDYSLSVMQQVSVNKAFDVLGDSGLFSINGPPGTGKTTLIKDVIAEIIVQRAKILANGVEFTIADDDYFGLPEALHDFSVVVASSNNAALENITLKLPERSELGDSFQAIRHLEAIAQHLMGNSKTQVWGTISAALGNSEKMKKFKTAMSKAEKEIRKLETTDYEKARAEFKNALHELDEILKKQEQFERISSDWQKGSPRSLQEQVSNAFRWRRWTKPQSPSFQFSNADVDLSVLREELGDAYSAADFNQAHEHDRHERLPGTSKSLERARAILFVKALALHESFIAANRAPFLKNLNHFLALLDNKGGPRTVEFAKDLWATFSLLVPVVSTTFHSFERLFGTLPRGSIPWLIIDEAGQATTPRAIVALSRAKRALIVGDPQQLDPVVTLNQQVDKAVAATFNVADSFLVTNSSLQSLADARNPFGTELNGRWVGSPLLVHRRCVDPMFSISNKLSYEGKMFLGRDKEQKERTLNNPDSESARLLIHDSAWIDVPRALSEPITDNSRRAETDIVADIVNACIVFNSRARDLALPKLFVIAPFRHIKISVKKRLRDAIAELYPNFEGADIDHWCSKSIGTVHSFQGQEAETVVLVLGGKKESGMNWVQERPNLLNVAVTRAQRRLYVVGDWDEWMSLAGKVEECMALDWKISVERAREVFDARRIYQRQTS
ncbi:ATP-binding protein (plasmid) [Rhizobium sp. CB3171]|uniref:DEAD/DEAH box helicase n=1 Tax=Rhizobium sp. CB3171 TaxID=3039157 RepID=UPI0024B0A419|nr:ATP-binding protein [Rhizobium sp. CB3171]WFU04680.1 ATP-binding protein [Rhizobium sp. CB3171]